MGDMLSIIKEYYADIGVDMEINVLEYGAFSAQKYMKMYPQMVAVGVGGLYSIQASPRTELSYYYTPGIFNYPDWDDAVFQERFEVAKQTQDDTERMELYQDLAIYALENAIHVLLPAPYGYTYWQPWVKGYWGQAGMFYADQNMLKNLWLDLDLKESITSK